MIPKSKQKKIASERIEILLDQAKKTFKKSKSLANRYVFLARKLSMKYKVKIPRELKRLYCKHCYKFLSPKNKRIKNKTIIYHCPNCKKISRYPFNKKKS